MIDSPWVGLKIYIRNKHLRRLRHFAPGRTLVFVHGATYPASTSFDLELEVDCPGWSTWRGFDVYMLDLPAMADRRDRWRWTGPRCRGADGEHR
jgi:hypothetical protein